MNPIDLFRHLKSALPEAAVLEQIIRLHRTKIVTPNVSSRDFSAVLSLSRACNNVPGIVAGEEQSQCLFLRSICNMIGHAYQNQSWRSSRQGIVAAI